MKEIFNGIRINSDATRSAVPMALRSKLSVNWVYALTNAVGMTDILTSEFIPMLRHKISRTYGT